MNLTRIHVGSIVGLWLLLSGVVSRAEIRIVTAHNPNDEATSDFKFAAVPPPAQNDAASNAVFRVVDGRQDANGGGPEVLHDGRIATEEDAPSQNFFFAAGTDGGRLLVDLGRAINIRQVNSYSWHTATRAPQVYTLYASDGKGAEFDAAPKKGTAPETRGWKLLAHVDSRPAHGPPGGQYGVSISDSSGDIGNYRYLLFDIARTEDQDAFGNTFYTEIDVVDRDGPALETAGGSNLRKAIQTIETDGGKYTITIETTAAPDLTAWATQELAPVVRQWYPKLVEMLPSEGYTAPALVSIVLREGMGQVPAATSGGRINCNIGWFRRNLKGEAKGAVVHEMVHVVQQYGRARRTNPDARRTPGWLVEGIADYIRWFQYEPASKGAEITSRNISRARYDASYRVTGNFLDWVGKKYDPAIVRKLNAAAREGKYSEDLWTQSTGKTVQELGEEWKKAAQDRINAESSQPAQPK